MRKIILGLAISLDSFIEGPNGEYDWCFTDQDYGMTDFLKSVDTIFYGRKSYELMKQASLEEVGSQWAHMTNYVFSNSYEKDGDDFILVNGDISQKINDVKSQPGKDIWLFGGASLTTALMNLGLVDQLWLSVHPILLGNGKPLFSGIKERVTTKLIDSKTYDTGLVSLKYDIVH